MKSSILILFVLFSNLSFACSYALPADTSLESRISIFKKNTNGIIFEGKIISIELDTNNLAQPHFYAPQYFLVQPKRCWSKINQRTRLIKIYGLGRSMCCYEFEVDSTYLIYAGNISEDDEFLPPVYYAKIYDPNKLISQADRDLQVLGMPIADLTPIETVKPNDSKIVIDKSDYILIFLTFSIVLNLLLTYRLNK